MKKSRTIGLIATIVLGVTVAAIWGYFTIAGASSTIDPDRIAIVERARRARQEES